MGMFLSTLNLTAQQRLSPQEIEAYKKEVRQLLSFLEFSLNTIGSSMTTSREKNIIISESYQKIFRDGEVQIEDDLAPYRSTVTNKDVQSYLKDIDFFFEEAQFTLKVEDIEHSINDLDQHYFLAQLNRTLKAKTVEGSQIENSLPRFVEINLDAVDRELKIASIYTTKVNELAGVNTWWNQLPLDWKMLFADKISVDENLTMRDVLRVNTGLKLGDTLFLPKRDTVRIISSTKLPEIFESDIRPQIDSSYVISREDTFFLNKPQTFSDIKNILDLREIDLSNTGLTDLAPISKMTRLRKLDISQNPISNLGPLKSLTLLKNLDFSQTQVQDISAVQFAPNLVEIRGSGSQVEDLGPVQYLQKLEIVDLSETRIKDLSPLSNSQSIKRLSLASCPLQSIESLGTLRMLEFLNLSGVNTSQLGAIAQLPSLNSLEINNTPVSSLNALSELVSLEKISLDNTPISSLDPLMDLPKLTNVYCDKTPISERQALDFMREKPGTLVIYKSDDLNDWWKSLSTAWKHAIGAKDLILSQPSKAQLQALANKKELDLRGNSAIEDVAPIRAFRNLESLLLDQTPITSLQALVALPELRILSFENTQVSSLEPLRGLENLEEINCSHTQVSTLLPLIGLQKLRKVQFDETRVGEILPLASLESLTLLSGENTLLRKEQVLDFLASNPDCLVLFHEEELTVWWDDLQEHWRDVFRQHISLTGNGLSSENLHAIEMLTNVNIEGNSRILSLLPLVQLQRLNTVQLTRTQVGDLSPLSKIPSLRRITCSQGPLQNLVPLSSLSQLEYLDISSTPIQSLEPIRNLQNLTFLGCSGTQIRDIKDISGLIGLKNLDISNTRVKSLKPIANLRSLTSLTCFNSKIPGGKIEAFKRTHPEVNVVFY